jgi:hypothetical protein
MRRINARHRRLTILCGLLAALGAIGPAVASAGTPPEKPGVENPKPAAGVVPAQVRAAVGVQRLDPTISRAGGLNPDRFVVLAVSPDSPAERAGIEPGDIILNARGKRLADLESAFPVGEPAAIGAEVTLDLIRGGAPLRKTMPTVARDAVKPVSLARAARSMSRIQPPTPDVAWTVFLTEFLVAAGFPDEAVRQRNRLLMRIISRGPPTAARLSGRASNPQAAERLAKATSAMAEGRIGDAIESLRSIAQSNDGSPETLLAGGRLREIEEFQDRITGLLLQQGRPDLAESMILRERPTRSKTLDWLLARNRLDEASARLKQPEFRSELRADLLEAFTVELAWRQGRSLDPPKTPLPRVADSELRRAESLRWQLECLDRRAPFVTRGLATPWIPMLTDAGPLGLLASSTILGVPVRVDGGEPIMAVIDTGADLSTLDPDVARRLNVKVGDIRSRAFGGGLAFEVKPGLVERMEVGGLSVERVPITVGAMPMFRLSKVRMLIGLDLLHHLGAEIDFPRRVARLWPADRPPADLDAKGAADVPLWRLPGGAVTIGWLPKTPEGAEPTVLTMPDTGNFGMSRVDEEFARRRGLIAPVEPPALFEKPPIPLGSLRVGGLTLPGFRPRRQVGEMLADVPLLLGADVFGSRRVIIDIRNPRLRLLPSQPASP